MTSEYRELLVYTSIMMFLVLMLSTLTFSKLLDVSRTINHVECDMNHDNELTIQDLSILAAQINNK